MKAVPLMSKAVLTILETYAEAIETALSAALPAEDTAEYGEVLSAARYSLLGGGKRIRGVLTLEFARLCGMEQAFTMPAACAVEMVHCYSLIHDDLPAMDNDDFRRGKPSCHKAYGEGMAILAGDLLLTKAFEVLLEAPEIAAEDRLKGGILLAEASGVHGMLGGQTADIKNENNRECSLGMLELINRLKTGKLIAAAAELGCIAAGADAEKRQAARTYAENLGAAFQIIDDVLDETGDQSVTGKAAGSDRKSGKRTYATILGVDEAVQLAKTLTEAGKAALKGHFTDCEQLFMLSDYLCDRDH